MDLPNLGTNPELDDIMQRARELDIEENLLDLAMYGFTVVPPEKMGTAELVPRLRAAILGVYRWQSSATAAAHQNARQTRMHPNSVT